MGAQMMIYVIATSVDVGLTCRIRGFGDLLNKIERGMFALSRKPWKLALSQAAASRSKLSDIKQAAK